MIVIFGRAVEDSGERMSKRKHAKKGWTDSAQALLQQQVQARESSIKYLRQENDSLNKQLAWLRKQQGLVATPVPSAICPECNRRWSSASYRDNVEAEAEVEYKRWEEMKASWKWGQGHKSLTDVGCHSCDE